MGDYGNTKVIQITNIAPQATRDQMHTLFSNIGKIEDLRLYPSVRDANIQVQSRCCFLKFIEGATIPLALHMTNTVFIDRAIIVQPFVNGDIPDEWSGLEFANSSTNKGEPVLPPHVTNVPDDEAGVINTLDPNLADSGLPEFPPLPAGTDNKVIEEVRRTITVVDIDPTLNAQAVIDYFGKGAGEVKYFRWCTKEGEDRKIALVEFTDYGAVIPAMRLNDTMLGDRMIKVYYATQSITKPQTKSNEAALQEIEEAMKKVKEAQNLVSDAVNPLKEWLGVKGRVTRSRSKSRDYYRRSRSRDRRSRRRSRSRDRYSSRRRSRSRKRRSKSRSRKKRSRSRRRSKSKKRSSRSKSRDRKSDKKSDTKEDGDKVKPDPDKVKSDPDEVKSEENGVKVKDEKEPVENGKEVKEEKKKSSRSRSRSRDRKRSKSRDRKRSKSRDRRRSRSRSRKKASRRSRSRDRRSRSRDRKKRSRSRRRSRSRSRDKKRRSRSRSRDHKKSSKSKKSRRSEERDPKKDKITRDYDAEEAGFESGANGKEEGRNGPVDMEISNSP